MTRLVEASGAQPVNDRRTAAEAVADLPGDYSAVENGTPVLGPPLPGDLGRPILARQRELAGSDNAAPATLPPPSAAEQAADAERQRLTSQAHQAREAGVLMQTAGQGGAASQSNPLNPAVVASTVAETAKLALDSEHDQNNQQRKIDFLERQPSDVAGTTSMHQLERPTSPFQIMAGSVISASLITGINSDLPGTVVAQVTENVFDTVTGQILLIPQGSRLIGSYDSVLAFGQKRALLAWQRIILPDGSSIQLDHVPASDAAGYSGLEDGVDFHTWQLLKGVALSTVLGVGTELSLGSSEGDLVRAIRQSIQQSAGQAGQQIISKNLNVQPTITIRPGWPLRVIVHKDIVLRPWGGTR
ncbi:MAG: TrbI/VirB10 family protein [Novosphingobium sp.]